MSKRKAQVAMEYVLIITGIIVAILVIAKITVQPKVMNMGNQAMQQGETAVTSHFKVGNE